jgi:hypothetical protein
MRPTHPTNNEIALRINPRTRKPKDMKKLLLGITMLSLFGCADPAFQRYVQSRQASIAAMPNGAAKYQAQAILDEQIYAEKRRQEAQAQAAVMAGAAGLAAAAEANAYRPYYYPQTVIITR